MRDQGEEIEDDLLSEVRSTLQRNLQKEDALYRQKMLYDFLAVEK